MNPSIPPAVPLAPAPKKNTNWWLIGGCGCLALIALACVAGGLLVFGVMKVVKGTEPYQTAVNTAANSAEVQAELGTPVEEGFMPQGNVNSNTFNGVTVETANLTVPLKGPKGTGHVHYAATKTGNTWQVSDFTVTIDGKDKKIDLKPTVK